MFNNFWLQTKQSSSKTYHLVVLSDGTNSFFFTKDDGATYAYLDGNSTSTGAGVLLYRGSNFWIDTGSWWSSKVWPMGTTDKNNISESFASAASCATYCLTAIVYHAADGYYYAVIGANDYNGICRSTNGGTSWTKLSSMTYQGVNTKGLCSDGTNLYYATYTNGIRISSNNGTTWSTMTCPTDNPTDVLFDGTAVWCSSWWGVWKTTDGGANWSEYIGDDVCGAYQYTSIAYDSTRGRIFVTGGDSSTYGLAYTDNGGTSWTHVQVTLGATLTGVRCLDGIIYIWKNSGFGISRDGGTTWSYPNCSAYGTNLNQLNVYSLL